MFGLHDSQWILVASALFSALLIVGLMASWAMGKKLSGQHYTYLVYYSLYLALVNIPGLILTILGEFPLSPWGCSAFNMLEIALIFLAAEAWRKQRTEWYRWLILVPAFVASCFSCCTDNELWPLLYGLSFGLVILLTVFNVSRNAPWYVALGISVSFGSWIILEATFLESGPSVGHVFGMLIKGMLLGTVMFATYERQHREVWRAALIRKEAIGIIVSSDQDVLRATDPD